jgi:hypothetical protein
MIRRISAPIARPPQMHPIGPPQAAATFGRVERFERALELMQDGCWQEAFQALAVLADDGHAQSARLALLFVRRGARLFGGSYAASAGQRQAWAKASD